LNKSEIIDDLKNELTPERFTHSINVAAEATLLAERWKIDVEKCEMAGLLHDCGKKKYINGEIAECEKYKIVLEEDDRKFPQILHSYISEKIAFEKYGIEDKEVLKAIKNHTIGEKNMGPIDKIIFISDMIEPGRKNIFQDIRQKAYENIDEAMLMAYNGKIDYSKKKSNCVHSKTITNRNELERQLMDKKGKC